MSYQRGPKHVGYHLKCCVHVCSLLMSNEHIVNSKGCLWVTVKRGTRGNASDSELAKSRIKEVCTGLPTGLPTQ